MKRIVERVLLGGFVGGLAVAGMASCSPASSTPPGGTGNTGNTGNSTNTSSGGASSTNHGGANSVGTGGANSSVGGNGVPQGGTGTVIGGGAGSIAGGSTGTAGTNASGGGGASGGTGGAAAVCSTDPNLVNATGCFVGCDPTLTTDNPDGIQGAFYGYGDGVTCPAMPPPPCTAAGACMTGTTMAVAADYGCGLGLQLNSKMAYTGPATCFGYTLTGNSGGNEVRIGFTQVAAPTGVSPYISIPAFNGTKTGTACIKDAICNGFAGCTPPSTTAPAAYDIQFQVVGGTKSGAFNLCLSSLTPVTSGTSTLTQICGAPGATDGTEPVDKYFAQNNVNNDPGAMQCITPSQSGSNVGFKIDSSNVQQGGNAPAAYPSIVDGWHYGKLSTDPNLPKLVSSLASVTSAVTYTGSNGKYDASYDIWVLPASSGTTPSGGLEVMIWLNSAGGAVPANTAGNTSSFSSANHTWNVSVASPGTVGNWSYVAYNITSGTNSFTGDLLPFINDAITRAQLKGTPYLAGIEFGFELWQPGNGFAVTSFSSTVTPK
jgi:Glycosyl hydrolase family 12